jgi:hypothetical protein
VFLLRATKNTVHLVLGIANTGGTEVMHAITTRLIATTLLLFAVQSGRAEEPTNPAPAALKKHIMVAPEEIEWGECPPFLPAGAKCTTVQPMTLMSIGLYNEPVGAFLASVLY